MEFALVACMLFFNITLAKEQTKTSSKDESDYFSQHDLCEHEIAAAESKYGIPYRLCMAISTVESGKSTNYKAKRPWPWTICAQGRGYFFTTKSAAIAAVKKLKARGVRNIDVGCMQVNLLHHSKAFKSLEEAFTPKCNVDYGAKFLTELRNAHQSWTKAVGYYHSKAEHHYVPYCKLVYNAWTNAKKRAINSSPKVRFASSEIKSKISFLPSYYSLVDKDVSKKLHKLGKMTLQRGTPKFFTKKDN